MTDKPFQVNPELTGIALAYRNTDYIADEILPRVPVAQKYFGYKKYGSAAFLNAPDAEIGRKGRPSTMELKSTMETAECIDYSISAEVPEDDIIEAAAATSAGNAVEDPMGDNTLLVTDGLMLAREKRVANLVYDEKTYGSNVATLSGDDRFTSKESSVIDVFTDVKNTMLVEPTHAVVSSAGAIYLQTHPDFLTVYKAENSNNKGIVPLDFVAQTLGLKKILVGKSKINNVKPGKTPVITSVWGDDMVFFYQNPLAKPKNGLTFGLTAQRGQLNVQTYFDGMLGSYGVHYIKPVETLAELILSGSCGYLVKDAFVKE